MTGKFKRIGIIAAMDKETEGLKAAVENPQVESFGGVDFVCGKIGDKEVIVAKSGIGKVFAAMCAQAMILKLSPDCIINTGIAGGLSRELKILDCVVADGVVQHDMDTSPIGDPVGLISGINLVKLPTDENISKALIGAAKTCGIKCKKGTVATGDQFVALDSQRNRIINLFGADCCEMEGGAVGQVCYVNKIPFGIIRTISDNYDSDVSMDYPVFAEKAADASIRLTLEFLKLI